MDTLPFSIECYTHNIDSAKTYDMIPLCQHCLVLTVSESQFLYKCIVLHHVMCSGDAFVSMPTLRYDLY